jgi:hypothetical protein
MVIISFFSRCREGTCEVEPPTPETAKTALRPSNASKTLPTGQLRIKNKESRTNNRSGIAQIPRSPISPNPTAIAFQTFSVKEAPKKAQEPLK